MRPKGTVELRKRASESRWLPAGGSWPRQPNSLQDACCTAAETPAISGSWVMVLPPCKTCLARSRVLCEVATGHRERADSLRRARREQMWDQGTRQSQARSRSRFSTTPTTQSGELSTSSICACQAGRSGDASRSLEPAPVEAVPPSRDAWSHPRGACPERMYHTRTLVQCWVFCGLICSVWFGQWQREPAVVLPA